MIKILVGDILTNNTSEIKFILRRNKTNYKFRQVKQFAIPATSSHTNINFLENNIFLEHILSVFIH